LRAAADQHDGADQPKNGANDVVHFELLARQKSREQHDQQRPEIIDQAGFGRRRETQREEIKRVIAEQAKYPERPDFRLLAQGADRALAEHPGYRAHQSANRKCHGGKLERRHAARRRGEQREQRPHQDGGEADQCRAGGGGHWNWA
jgi:hypothetical protein